MLVLVSVVLLLPSGPLGRGQDSVMRAMGASSYMHIHVERWKGAKCRRTLQRVGKDKGEVVKCHSKDSQQHHSKSMQKQGKFGQPRANLVGQFCCMHVGRCVHLLRTPSNARECMIVLLASTFGEHGNSSVATATAIDSLKSGNVFIDGATFHCCSARAYPVKCNEDIERNL